MKPLLIALLGILLVHLAAPAAEADCHFPASPRVVDGPHGAPGKGVFLEWSRLHPNDLENRQLPISRTLQRYRESVRSAISVEPQFLLNRYVERAQNAEDLFNLQLVIARSAGEIREIRCIEALLLDFQISRTPLMLEKPTEFIAYFLVKDQNLKIYYYTSDSEGVSGMRRLIQELETDRNKGWRIVGNLHNHSFFLNDLEAEKPQGVLSPSRHDMKILNEHALALGLSSASITNGFDTIYIEAGSFSRFKAAE